MKRIISVLLAVCMVFCQAGSVAAEEADYSKYYEDTYENYKNVMEGWTWQGYLQVDSLFGFVQMDRKIDEHPNLQKAVLFALKLAEGFSMSDAYNENVFEDVEVGFYEDAILSLLMTMEQDITGDLQKQAQADVVMTLKDYAVEGAQAVGGAVNGLFVDGTEIAKSLSVLIDGTSGSMDVLSKTIDSLQTQEQYTALSQYARNYGQFERVLTAILDYSSDENLKKAARNVQNALKQCFEYKMDHVMNYLDEAVIPNLSSFFFDDILTQALDKKELEVLELSSLCNFASGIAAFNAGAKIGSFVSNAGFGSHDIFLRYFEMRAMSKIRDCLIKQVGGLKGSINGPEDYKAIEETQKNLYALLYTVSRGEYCLYSLVEKDAKGTGVIAAVLDFFKGKEHVDRDQWYSYVCETIKQVKYTIQALNPDISEYQSTAMYSAYSNKIQEYEKEYGTAQINKVSEEMFFLSGVCFVSLIDFGKVGQRDLLLVYSVPQVELMWGNEFRFEIWRYENDEMKLMDSGDLMGADGGTRYICITQYNGKIYLVTGANQFMEQYSFHGESSENISIVHEIKVDNIAAETGEREYLIDGGKVAIEEYQNDKQKWLEKAEWYPLNGYIDNYNSILEMLEENNNTKEIIKSKSV